MEAITFWGRGCIITKGEMEMANSCAKNANEGKTRTPGYELDIYGITDLSSTRRT